MSLKDSIAQAQKYLEDMMKKHRYKKANAARQVAVEERVDYMNCAGKLNQCLTEFKITIKSQVIHIREGEMFQRDTALQEIELRHAAIGYMLVKDAQYALKSLYNHNSVQYAYDLLNGVTKYMNGDRLNLPMINGVKRSKDRNIHGYLTSDKAIRDKEIILEGFFEELKRNGDIEACLAKALRPAEKEGDRRYGSGDASGKTGGTGGNTQKHRNVAENETPVELEMDDLDSIDIYDPTATDMPLVSEQDAMRAVLDAMESNEEEKIESSVDV
ncbi:MAG: hypothetical protein IKT58_00935 [Oscillospiraceae bacterium]|nr:hypothetical protein [Oscillospiraceae bacterium]